MTPTKLDEQAPVAPPAYHRAQAQQAGLHIDVVRLVTTLHLWALCRVVLSFALINGAFPTDNLPMITPRSASRRFLMKISATIMWHVIVAHLFRIRAARAKSPVLPP